MTGGKDRADDEMGLRGPWPGQMVRATAKPTFVRFEINYLPKLEADGDGGEAGHGRELSRALTSAVYAVIGLRSEGARLARTLRCALAWSCAGEGRGRCVRELEPERAES